MTDLRLAVFGPGLLGGSLLLDARAHGWRELRVWARREESLAAVKQKNLADFCSTSAASVAEHADLLILCVPVGAMPALAHDIARGNLSAGAVITDAGSVKGWVMREVAPVFRAAGRTFIGSHPMAGSEKAGFGAARAGLYQQAACIVTPPPEAPPASIDRVVNFWQSLGCRTTIMDPDTHDAVVARISHLPHAAAVLTALTAFTPDPMAAEFAAGGLRDTTRIAAGDPSMWSEILLTNREALLPALRELRDAAGHMVAMIENRDEAALAALLEEARRLRATRYH